MNNDKLLLENVEPPTRYLGPLRSQYGWSCWTQSGGRETREKHRDRVAVNWNPEAKKNYTTRFAISELVVVLSFKGELIKLWKLVYPLFCDPGPGAEAGEFESTWCLVNLSESFWFGVIYFLDWVGYYLKRHPQLLHFWAESRSTPRNMINYHIISSIEGTVALLDTSWRCIPLSHEISWERSP